MKSGEVNESDVVLLLGGVVFPLLPFLAVVLFSVVFPSCVVLFSSSLRWCCRCFSEIELNTVKKIKLSPIRRSPFFFGLWTFGN